MNPWLGRPQWSSGLESGYGFDLKRLVVQSSKYALAHWTQWHGELSSIYIKQDGCHLGGGGVKYELGGARVCYLWLSCFICKMALRAIYNYLSTRLIVVWWSTAPSPSSGFKSSAGHLLQLTATVVQQLCNVFFCRLVSTSRYISWQWFRYKVLYNLTSDEQQ